MGELSELPCCLQWKMNLARLLKKMIKKRKVFKREYLRILKKMIKIRKVFKRVFSDYDGTYEKYFCCEKQKNRRGWRRDS